MGKTVRYKKQGTGEDSWEIIECDGDEVIAHYMTYEDPNKLPSPEVDIVSILMKKTPEELNQIKQILSL
jgi:hypothetical protein